MKPAAVLSGIGAALGLSVALCSTGVPSLLGAGAALLSTAAAVLCLAANRRKNNSIFSLQLQLADFLEGKIKTPAFSVNDDDFAVFENAVVELETRLLLERENTRRASRRNADFIADVSHQLKTPLAGLKLYCEMGGGTADSAYTEKQLILIEHMESLIASLLRLEKLRADAYEMKFVSADLSGIAGDARNALLAIYPGKDITVFGDARLRCDVDWMGEAISNLLKNACEHTAPGGIITVAIESSDASVSVVVEDDGGGVTEGVLPMLFERFSQGGAPAVKPGGVGLGLSIAKTIVEKHHGAVFAENGAAGLRIILCLPVLDGLQPL
jgi:signal transduction histidine kinase